MELTKIFLEVVSINWKGVKLYPFLASSNSLWTAPISQYEVDLWTLTMASDVSTLYTQSLDYITFDSPPPL